MSDVLRKHLRVLTFLSISTALGYILAVVSDTPQAIYLTPVINYLLFAIEKELKNEGVLKAIKR